MLGSSEKLILYSPSGRIQNSEKELINYPPEGYVFKTAKISPIIKNSFVFDKLRLRFIDKLMPLNLVKPYIDSAVPSDVDLVYSYNHIVPHDISWVVNVEWSHVLVGRELLYFKIYKPIIERYLSSDNCKGIFAWTGKARDSILNCYNTKYFAHKIKVVPPGIHHRDYDRDYSVKDKLRILFVGSIDTPEDFYAKGGIEVIHAFDIIKKYHDVELTIRANVPDNIDLDGIKVIRNILPKTEFEELFKQADIFVLPSHYAQEMVVLEAMSWGLPVISSRIATLDEYINNGVDGLILQETPPINYFNGDYLVSETTDRLKLVEQIKRYHKFSVVEELVSLLNRLIDNQPLRKSIGEKAKQSADMSIARRNNLLKEVFDKC